MPASAYSLFLIWGDRVKGGTGDCVEVAEAGWSGVSSRRDAPLTWGRKRGEFECAQDEADVRREAWYGRACAWKAAEGEEGADMVGDEVSMASLMQALLAAGERQSGPSASH